MEPLQFWSVVTEEDKNVIRKGADAFEKKYGHLLDRDKMPKLGSKMQINWACGWNSPRNVGSDCIVLAANNYYAVVLIDKGKGREEMSAYRIEDLSDFSHGYIPNPLYMDSMGSH